MHVLLLYFTHRFFKFSCNTLLQHSNFTFSYTVTLFNRVLKYTAAFLRSCFVLGLHLQSGLNLEKNRQSNCSIYSKSPSSFKNTISCDDVPSSSIRPTG